ncbi:MAG TPA: cytochrome d ubiquinol oxidase subunit II [Actinopolymorphaceae bacterium]|nr:cytochrome d ubiquinol oxidase subunit II [Actinopolymorphaceae bacterium]
MTAAALVGLVLLLAVTAYSCGGGTDYGAGLWDLTAGNSERGARPRALIDYAMAPVWEVNNVWLVFVLVVTWTGFPGVFAAVFSAAWISLTFAVLGLILRGVGFAFRKPTRHLARRRRYSAVFGVASLLTPFFFAATLGGIASGRVPLGSRDSTLVTTWLNPTSVVFGAVSLAAAAFIGAVFLVGDAHRFGAPELADYFKLRAVLAGAAFLVLGGVALLVLRSDAAYVFGGMWHGWGLPFTLAAPVLAVVTAVLVSLGTQRLTRVVTRLTAIGAVGSAVFAWGVAQRPYLLPTTLTVEQGASSAPTLHWLVIVAVVALVLVTPPLLLLYRLDIGGALEADHDQDLSRTADEAPADDSPADDSSADATPPKDT